MGASQSDVAAPRTSIHNKLFTGRRMRGPFAHIFHLVLDIGIPIGAVDCETDL